MKLLGPTDRLGDLHGPWPVLGPVVGTQLNLGVVGLVEFHIEDIGDGQQSLSGQSVNKATR